VKLLSWRLAGIGALLIAAGGMAHAEEVNATFVAPVFKLGNNTIGTGQVSENADGSFTMSGNDGSQDRGWVLGWNLNVDYDPFINGTLSLTNFTASDHDYTLVLDLPVPAFGPSSVYGGSLTATVFDDNGNSSAVLKHSAGSLSIYQGTIDEIGVLNLFPDISCGGSGPNCSVTFTDQAGLPGPTIPGPGVNGHIGTILKFNLSAGDRVVFNTNFTVNPVSAVPLPASVWMLIAALGCMSYFFGANSRMRSVIHPHHG